MENNSDLNKSSFGNMANTPSKETPFKRPKKRRAIATPPTFFIPRSRPQITPLTYMGPGRLQGKYL